MALIVPILIFTMAVPSVSEAQDIRSYKVAQGDPQFPLFPFPPWDVGPLPGGFSADILNAICDVNRKMECEIVVKRYDECILSDFTQPTTVGIGSVLLGENIVGCLTWGRTNPRLSRGIVTTNAYSNPSAPGTNDSVILSANGSINTGNSLAIENGVAADLACANAAGHAYTVQEVSNFFDILGAVDFDTDAIILVANLAFLLPLPTGVLIATTFESDGTTPLRCVNGVRVITYPPGNFEDTHNFISDFNCGLSLIAQNGTYEQICAIYAPNSSVAPYCFDPSEIEEPTNACTRLKK